MSCSLWLNHDSNTGKKYYLEMGIMRLEGVNSKKIKSGNDPAEYLHKVFRGLNN